MKITILCENQLSYKGAEVCLAEWGFSAFVQINDVNILFDTGHTGIYKHNAEQLGINLQETNFVVLSHYHWDHAGGIQHHNFKDKKKLIIHPEIINKLPLNESRKIKSDFEIITSKRSLEFSDNVYYLGEIPRKNNFEKGMYKNDKMLDDSAIAIRSKNGAIVIAGCSHCGICNICEYAKEVTGQKLHAVIGGFHLFQNDQETVDRTIEYFKAEKPEHLYPMHCVDFPTLAKFHLIFGIQKLSTGDEIEFV
ncbi:MAG: MBL fold metallo-hydrolase [Candidatus Pacebacteria bacterium]|nr:MBL fold metallo-hydrolase [Candidatus Paceibacterota bacterium]